MIRLLALFGVICGLIANANAFAQSGFDCITMGYPPIGTLPTTPGLPDWTISANGVSVNTTTGAYTLVPFTASFWRSSGCPGQLLMTLDTSGAATDLGSFSIFQNGQTATTLDLNVEDKNLATPYYVYLTGLQNLTSAIDITGLVVIESAAIDASQAMAIDFTASYYIEPHPPIIEIQIPAASSSTPPPFVIGNGMTGNWFDPNESGHGFGIEVLPGGSMLAEWYVFAPQGGRDWIIATGPITGNTAVLTAFQAGGSGGRFPPNFNAAQVQTQAWGTITFTFTDCNNGTASWQPTASGYPTGSIPIQRLTMPAGLACP